MALFNEIKLKDRSGGVALLVNCPPYQALRGSSQSSRDLVWTLNAGVNLLKQYADTVFGTERKPPLDLCLGTLCLKVIRI